MSNADGSLTRIEASAAFAALGMLDKGPANPAFFCLVLNTAIVNPGITNNTQELPALRVIKTTCQSTEHEPPAIYQHK